MRKVFQFFAIFFRQRRGVAQNHQRAIVCHDQFDVAQVTNALQPGEADAHFWKQCLKMGHQNGALLHVNNVAGAGLAKPHLQTIRFWLIAEAQARTTTIAPGLIRNNLVNVMFQQTRQGTAFAFLLQFRARMLLLTASTDAKVGATRFHAFPTIVEATLHLSAGVLAFIFCQRNFCSFCWQ